MENNQDELQELTKKEMESLGHLVEIIAWETWLLDKRREPGDLEILEGNNGQFEGAVRLLKLESYYTCLDTEEFTTTQDWARPIGFRVERWLIEWVSVDEVNWKGDGHFDRASYPSNWFTQATMAGKKGHRQFYTPSREPSGVVDFRGNPYERKPEKSQDDKLQKLKIDGKDQAIF